MTTLLEVEQFSLELERAKATVEQLRLKRNASIAECYSQPHSPNMSALAGATKLSIKQISLIIKQASTLKAYEAHHTEDQPDLTDPQKRLDHIVELRLHGVPVVTIAQICSTTVDYVIHVLNTTGTERITIG